MLFPKQQRLQQQQNSASSLLMTTATAVVAVTSSFALGYFVSSSSSSSLSLLPSSINSSWTTTTTKKSYNILQQYWQKYNLKENYTIWIGSLWFLVNRHTEQLQQQQETASSSSSSSSSSIWRLVSDALFLGTILLSQTQINNKVITSDDADVDVDDDKKNTNKRDSAAADVVTATESSVSRDVVSTTPVTAGVSALLVPLNDRHRGRSDSISSATQKTTTTTTTHQTQQQQQRYLELLVHNVSHTDLVLSAEPPSNGAEDTKTNDDASSSSSSEINQDSFCLSRPRFSAFDEYSRRILQYVVDGDKDGLELISFPRHERRNSDVFPEKYEIVPEPKQRKKIPIGFSLVQSSTTTSSSSSSSSSNQEQQQQQQLLTVTPEEMSDLRFRGRDASRVVGVDQPVKLNAVFFPLLATMLPLWHSRIDEKYGTTTSQQQQQQQQSSTTLKKVLILVSGVGSPRNWTHSINGNSTDKCAKLMKLFCKRLFPELVVVQVHSSTLNIFRYDENITFVQKELMPTIQSYRDAHAKGLPYPDEVVDDHQRQRQRQQQQQEKPFDTEWRKSMHVTLSFADGSPARNHAIQAALRPYRPTYYHCWQLKTFWHEFKVVESDIEVHTYEEMETLPPIETASLNQERSIVSKVVEEMKKFRNETIQILANNDNDIRKFWLRKTQKPVLAVLAVQTSSPDGGNQIKLYRGTNMEVSMPTGSLCAERNVIGTALADNPSLKRQDLKAIAVLSVPNPNAGSSSLAAGGGAGGTISRTTSTASLGTIEYYDTTTTTNSLQPQPPQNSKSIPPLAPPITVVAPPQSSASSSLLNMFRVNTSSRSVSSDNTATTASTTTGTTTTTTKSSNQLPSSIQPKKSTTATRKTEDGDWIFQDVTSALPFLPPTNTEAAATMSVTPAITSESAPASVVPPCLDLGSHAPSGGLMVHTTPSPSTPARRMQLYANNPKKQKRTIIFHSHKDLNPLRPCGACNEWLKKIAESNPYFEILTFTDSDMNGVYCTPCEE